MSKWPPRLDLIFSLVIWYLPVARVPRGGVEGKAPRAEIERMEGLAKQHVLNPEARRINKSLGDLTGITGLGFHIIEVTPGHESTEYHVHHYEDECVYVLSGNATVRIGDRRYRGQPGRLHRLSRGNAGMPWDLVDSEAIEHPTGGRKI